MIERCAADGVNPGYPLGADYPEFEDGLLVALTIYAINLIVAAFISRPNLRRLLRMDSGDPAAWNRRARRQRYVAYGMAAAIGVIGLLMRTKPTLW